MRQHHLNTLIKFTQLLLITIGLELAAAGDDLEFWEVFLEKAEMGIFNAEEILWISLGKVNNKFVQKQFFKWEIAG